MKEERKSRLIKITVSALALFIILVAAYAQEKPKVNIPLVSGSSIEYYHIDVDLGTTAKHMDTEGTITITDEEIMFNNPLYDSTFVVVIVQDLPVQNEETQKAWLVHTKGDQAARFLVQRLKNVGVFIASPDGTMILFITNKEAAYKTRLPEMDVWYPLELE